MDTLVKRWKIDKAKRTEIEGSKHVGGWMLDGRVGVSSCNFISNDRMQTVSCPMKFAQAGVFVELIFARSCKRSGLSNVIFLQQWK